MNNYFLGLRALERRDYARAIGCFSRALALDAADIDSQAERGFAHLEAGDLEEARGDCQAVLRVDASHGRGCQLLERLSSGCLTPDEPPPESSAQAVASAGAAAADWLKTAGASQVCILSAPAGTIFGYETSLSDQPAEISGPAEAAAPVEVTAPAEPVEPAPVVSEASESTAMAGVELADLSASSVAAPADEYGLAPLAGKSAPATEARSLTSAASPAPAKPANAPTKDLAATGLSQPWTWRSAWNVTRAALASAAVHAAVLVALALAVVHVRARSDELVVVATTVPASAGKAEPFVFAASQGDEATGPLAAVGGTIVSARFSSMPKLDMTPKVESHAAGTMELALVDRGLGTSESTDLLREYEPLQTTELAEQRSEEGRRAAVIARGGTPQSEAAVDRALVWLVRHQNYDGSWSFDHRFCGNCRSACENPGILAEARVGATAMALLPFLGAGHTPNIDKYGEGSKYGKQVLAGLRFLVRSMRKDGGMNEPTGRMYDHGLASIVLCEAYGMTRDRTLLKPAERSLAYIVMAQDPLGGGWRYQPQMPGDTSVVGWQIMAIKSGQMAYLRVPQSTIDGASRFLDSVALDEGAGYGYVDTNYGTEATSAVGLLCRMYLGWKRDNPALTRGVQTLSTLEPSTSNMYFNYYATQVLHHYEGPLWAKWNDVMREYLVRSQSERGHETGSWYFDGDRHGSRAGGRLYCTSLAAMTLEVYYRHMPLYSKRAVLDKLGQ